MQRNLHRRVLLTAGILAAAAIAVGPRAGPAAQETRRRADSTWRCEPLVVVDCAGTTWLGRHLSHLAVYNDGRVTFARFGFWPEEPVMLSRDLSIEAVERLHGALVAAGGLRLADEELGVTQRPLTTVTVFDGGTDALAHTFSYWMPHGDYAPVQDAIEGFCATLQAP